MILSYLERRKADVLRLEVSLQNKTVHDFNVLGHQLKGTARNYGFPCLEKIARKMEVLSADVLEDEGSALLAEFKAWLQEKLSAVEAEASQKKSPEMNL